MKSHPVIEDEVERDGVNLAVELLGEGVGEPRETPYRHAHREVLALNVGRAHMVDVR